MYYNAKSIQKLIEDGNIKIEPYIKQYQGPNLYYCHLGGTLLIPQTNKLADTKNISKDLYTIKEINNYYDLQPGEFVLAETFEVFMTDKSHIIRLFNSSSLARLGIVQCAVGMINPGCGIKQPLRLTLELTNTSPFVIRLYPTITNKITGEIIDIGTEILKVAVSPHEEVETAYEDWSGAIYATDQKVTGSKIDKRFK
jgi:deoxycytidine triphosphate deaminase